jgi:hypothetical protein
MKITKQELKKLIREEIENFDNKFELGSGSFKDIPGSTVTRFKTDRSIGDKVKFLLPGANKLEIGTIKDFMSAGNEDFALVVAEDGKRYNILIQNIA